MPIKPENKGLYPPWREWLAIRYEVLCRDDHACKFCGVNNRSLGYRDDKGKFWPAGFLPKLRNARKLPPGMIRIVLTIAHLDHNPGNNGKPGNRPNLAALCQRCHLAYDAKHHAQNARKTRERKKGQTNLLEAP